MDFLAAEFDRLQSRIDQHLDPRGYGRGKTKIVGGRHAIDDGARVVAACYGPDHGAIIRHGGAAGQSIGPRAVIKDRGQSGEALERSQSLQGLVHRGARAEIGKVARVQTSSGLDSMRASTRERKSVSCSTAFMSEICDKFRTMAGSVVLRMLPISDGEVLSRLHFSRIKLALLKLDPCRRVIARLLPSSRLNIHPRTAKLGRQRGTDQQMVHSQARTLVVAAAV